MNALAIAQSAAAAFTNKNVEHDAGSDEVFLNAVAAMSLLSIAEDMQSAVAALDRIAERVKS